MNDRWTERWEIQHAIVFNHPRNVATRRGKNWRSTTSDAEGGPFNTLLPGIRFGGLKPTELAELLNAHRNAVETTVDHNDFLPPVRGRRWHR